MKRNYYTVYDNRTDEIVATGYADECARQMNRSVSSFYCTVNRNRSGKHRKYIIVVDPCDLDEVEKAPPCKGSHVSCTD